MAPTSRSILRRLAPITALLAAAITIFAAACGDDQVVKSRNGMTGPMAAIGVDSVSGASIETNQDDYVPGQIVHLVMKKWAPNEDVRLVMTEDPDTHGDVDTTVTVDENGEWSGPFYDVQEHDFGVTFTLTGTGQTSGSVATAVFSDGHTFTETTVNGTTLSTTDVTVTPGQSLAMTLTATTTCTGSSSSCSGSPTPSTTDDWQATKVEFSQSGGGGTTTIVAVACDNGVNVTSAAAGVTQTLSASPTAPTGLGTWAVTVTAYTDDACTASAGSKKWNKSLIVAAPVGPTKLAFISSPLSQVVGQCSGIVQVGTKNASDVLTNPTSNLTVGLATTSSGAFYSDASCTTSITSVTILSSGNTANFYYKDMTVGGPTLTASATGLTSATQVETISQAGTGTSVATSGTPSIYGASVTFTATVTASSPGSGIPAGNVAFKDGTDCSTGVQIGSDQALDGTGKASVSTTGLQGGSHTIWACYAGNTNYGSSSGSVAQTVDKAATTTVASASPSPSVYGQSVTFKAKVTWGGGDATSGNVKFFLGTACSGTQIGSDAALNGVGEATVSTSTLAASTTAYDIKACYQGTTNLDISNGATTHTVNEAETSLVLTDDTDPTVDGESFTLTAAVSITAPGAGTLAGTVYFYRSGTCASPGTAIGSDGAAPYQVTTSLPVGSYPALLACYKDDPNFADSYGTQAHTVNKAATSLVLTDDSDPTVYGESFTLTAAVSITAPGSGTLTGTVYFYQSGSCASPGIAIGSGDGTAPYEITTTLPVGSYPALLACYKNDPSFADSYGTQAHTVNKAGTSLVLTDDNDPSVYGESFTLTAAVSITSPGAGTLAGTVYFYRSGTCASPGIAIGSDGTAPYEVTTTLPAASYPALLACYEDDPNFEDSFGTQAHTVNKAVTTTALTSTHNPSVWGQSVTFNAVVSITAPGGGTLDGTVSFYDFGAGQDCTTHGSALETDPVATASYTSSALSVATHNIGACYSGSTNYETSDKTLTQVVDKAATTTALTSTHNPSVWGQSVTFNATVSITAPGGGTLDGTVSFYDFGAGQDCVTHGSALETDPVASASYTSSALSAGSHKIGACYSGSTNYETSDKTLAQVVDKASISSTASATPSSQQYSDKVTLSTVLDIESPGALNGQTLTGTVTFKIGTRPAGTAAVSTSSLPLTVTLSPKTALTEDPASSPYTVKAEFSSTNDNFDAGTRTDASLTVTKEDASVSAAAGNVGSIPVAQQTVTLAFNVKETYPEPQPSPDPSGLAASGDINNVSTLTAIMNGVADNGNYEGKCTAQTVQGTGYSAVRPFSCVFTGPFKVDAYTITLTVGINYYTGSDEDVLSVYDPTAGFVTGGGKFIDADGARVSFGMSFTYTGKGKTGFRGAWVVVKHHAGGGLCRVKSNTMNAPSVVGTTASLSGKSNYSCVDAYGQTTASAGNIAATGYVEDNGTSGIGQDKFWIRAFGQLLMSTPAAGNARTLTGGNIQVPQPSK